MLFHRILYFRALVSFIGQNTGDSILMKSPQGKFILVDEEESQLDSYFWAVGNNTNKLLKVRLVIYDVLTRFFEE